MRDKSHEVDLCVVGGGLAGMCVAIAAAREGVKVALMHDRPVLGGNASSEIRMWICGAHGDENRETGIIEEILSENLYRNPRSNYSIWDSVLYEKVRFEENITLLLNCSCNDATVEDSKIKSVKGWQLTTETWHTVYAKYFADCSGDSILAPLSGAEFRIGRESRDEFNESIAPSATDKKTMGMSCLIQAREMSHKVDFIPPSWANVYDDKDLPERGHLLKGQQNFWWLELGGENDSIHDTEELRDELLKAAFGVWSHIKNRGEHGADNWDLEWVGFLPGKRESRRYIGEYILTQNDIRAEGKFDDIVAYGGWSMDDHFPAGLKHEGYPTIFHEAPSPYGIPYRSLYSKNIKNLFFAGRNISATHAAMSSTRVMATCAILGEAVGVAASVCVKNSVSPSEAYKKYIKEIQSILLDNGCRIPWKKREITRLTMEAKKSHPNSRTLENSEEHSLEEDSSLMLGMGESVEYSFDEEKEIKGFRLVFDSSREGSHRISRMRALYPLNYEDVGITPRMVKAFRIEAQKDGEWKTIFAEQNNYQRLVKINIHEKSKAFRLVVEKSYGEEKVRLFSWDLLG